MSWPLPWWAYLLIWWAGMIPAAVYAGNAQRKQIADEGKPYPDSTLIVLVVAWPFFLAIMPIVVAHLVAKEAKRKPKAKGDGKSKR